MGRELDNIDLTSAQRKEVTTLLSRYIPDAEVWAYGSRVKFSAKPNSDLDLVAFISPKQKRAVYQLKEAFEESSLPFRVDLFVWDDVPAQFHKNIEKERVVLQRKWVIENKWTKTIIGEFCPFIYGKSLIRKKRCDSGKIPVFGSNGIIGTHLKAYVNQAGIIIGRKGTVGAVTFSSMPFWPIDTTFYITSESHRDLRFTYYLLKSLDLEYMNEDSAVPGLNREAVHSRKIIVPLLSEQKAIASVLGALDDKIENNRRMNETLEEMARAVFKSWFVDFDPVHAKATLQNHSPLEGESANQRQSPQMSRWGGIKRQYTSKAQQRAQTLRKNPTDAEGLLWHYLRKKQLAGRKFRRQQPIGNYIVDFVCMSEKLVIELDGSQHAKQKSYDANRDQFIQDSGYRVLRYWNNQVLSDCYAVLEDIYNHLCPPPHQSSPDGSTSATPPPGGSDNHPPLDIEPMAHPLDTPPGGSDNHPPLDIEPMAHPLDTPPGGSDNHPPFDIEPMAHPLDAPPGGSDNHHPLDIEPMAHPLDTPPGGSDNHPPFDIEPMAHPLDAPPGGSDNHPPLDLEPMAHPLDAPPGGSDNHPPPDIEPMAHPLDAPPGGSDNHPPPDIEPMAHPLDAPPGGSDNHPPLEGGSNSATPNLGRGNWTLERAKRYLAHIDTATAALFPSAFGEDGLPQGWRIRTLSDLNIEIESGRRPKGGIDKSLKEGIPSLGAESVTKIGEFDYSKIKFVKTNFARTIANGWVQNYDVAIYKDGANVGDPTRVSLYGDGFPFDHFLVNEHVFLVRSKTIGQPFLYYLFQTQSISHYLRSMGTSKVAQPGLNQQEVNSCAFVNPTLNLFEIFNKTVRSLVERQLAIGKENQTLAELRDTLLPKLMSGEIRIKDAEREVEAIA